MLIDLAEQRRHGKGGGSGAGASAHHGQQEHGAV